MLNFYFFSLCLFFLFHFGGTQTIPINAVELINPNGVNPYLQITSSSISNCCSGYNAVNIGLNDVGCVMTSQMYNTGETEAFVMIQFSSIVTVYQIIVQGSSHSAPILVSEYTLSWSVDGINFASLPAVSTNILLLTDVSTYTLPTSINGTYFKFGHLGPGLPYTDVTGIRIGMIGINNTIGTDMLINSGANGANANANLIFGSSAGNIGGYGPSRAAINDRGCAMTSTAVSTVEAYLTIQFPYAVTTKQIIVAGSTNPSGYGVSQYTLSYSIDGVTYTSLPPRNTSINSTYLSDTYTLSSRIDAIYFKFGNLLPLLTPVGSLQSNVGITVGMLGVIDVVTPTLPPTGLSSLCQNSATAGFVASTGLSSTSTANSGSLPIHALINDTVGWGMITPCSGSLTYGNLFVTFPNNVTVAQVQVRGTTLNPTYLVIPGMYTFGYLVNGTYQYFPPRVTFLADETTIDTFTLPYPVTGTSFVFQTIVGYLSIGFSVDARCTPGIRMDLLGTYTPPTTTVPPTTVPPTTAIPTTIAPTTVAPATLPASIPRPQIWLSVTSLTNSISSIQNLGTAGLITANSNGNQFTPISDPLFGMVLDNQAPFATASLGGLNMAGMTTPLQLTFASWFYLNSSKTWQLSYPEWNIFSDTSGDALQFNKNIINFWDHEDTDGWTVVNGGILSPTVPVIGGFDQWYHMAVVYDVSVGYATAYINGGTLAGGYQSTTNTFTFTQGQAIVLGNVVATGTHTSLPTKYAQTMFFNSVLTAAQVSALYTYTTPTPLPYSSSQVPFSSSQTPFSSSKTQFSSSQIPFSSSQSPFSSSQIPFSSSQTPTTIAPTTAVPTTATPAPQYDVFLLIGQSNAVGCGQINITDYSLDQPDPRVFSYLSSTGIVQAMDPLEPTSGCALDFQAQGYTGIGFAMTFAKQYANYSLTPGRRVLLVPAAFGGTGFGDPNHLWIALQSGGLYNAAITAVTTALTLAGTGSVFKGFLWHQGENDVIYGSLPFNYYTADLDTLIYDFRSNVSVLTNGAAAATAPFLLGELNQQWMAVTANAYFVDGLIVNTTLRDSKTCVASSIGLSSDPWEGLVHFSAPAQRILGTRYYTCYLATTIPPNPAINLAVINSGPTNITFLWSATREALSFKIFFNHVLYTVITPLPTTAIINDIGLHSYSLSVPASVTPFNIPVIFGVLSINYVNSTKSVDVTVTPLPLNPIATTATPTTGAPTTTVPTLYSSSQSPFSSSQTPYSSSQIPFSSSVTPTTLSPTTPAPTTAIPTTNALNLICNISNPGITTVNNGVSSWNFTAGGVQYPPNPTFTFVAGQTYEFDVTATGHPFWIKNNTGTGSLTGAPLAYMATMTTNNGAQTGVVILTIPFSLAGTTLYYNCGNHLLMEGIINIVSGNSTNCQNLATIAPTFAPSTLSPTTGAPTFLPTTLAPTTALPTTIATYTGITSQSNIALPNLASPNPSFALVTWVVDSPKYIGAFAVGNNVQVVWQDDTSDNAIGIITSTTSNSITVNVTTVNGQAGIPWLPWIFVLIVTPTTAIPTTIAPTTVTPTTIAPTTIVPTTIAATTVAPTTVTPTTIAPTTIAATTITPTTVTPTTVTPTTIAATTAVPTTLGPTTTAIPTTIAPTTAVFATTDPLEIVTLSFQILTLATSPFAFALLHPSDTGSAAATALGTANVLSALSNSTGIAQNRFINFTCTAVSVQVGQSSSFHTSSSTHFKTKRMQLKTTTPPTNLIIQTTFTLVPIPGAPQNASVLALLEVLVEQAGNITSALSQALSTIGFTVKSNFVPISEIVPPTSAPASTYWSSVYLWSGLMIVIIAAAGVVFLIIIFFCGYHRKKIFRLDARLKISKKQYQPMNSTSGKSFNLSNKIGAL